jgi:hypothetical protein
LQERVAILTVHQAHSIDASAELTQVGGIGGGHLSGSQVVSLLLMLVLGHIGACNQCQTGLKGRKEGRDTAILAVADALVGPSFLRRQGGNDLHSGANGQEVNEANVAISNNLDLVNVAKARQIIAQSLFSAMAVQATDVDVSASSLVVNSLPDRRRDRRLLAPSNFAAQKSQRVVRAQVPSLQDLPM